MGTTPTFHPMPREGAAEFSHEYRGVTLGKRSRTYWAMWHATAGWINTGETLLAAAKGVVDFYQLEAGA